MISDSQHPDTAIVRAPIEGLVVDRFDSRSLRPFVERSISEGTRRAYRFVVGEFFSFVRVRHPREITSLDVQSWRDQLIKSNKRASTVAFKLSVIRSMFDYLKSAGYVDRNPALTKLVPPPPLPEDLRGRVLTPKEVRYVLAGPDRSKAIGARDYALLLLLLRTSMRAAEACSLRASAIRRSHGRWILKFKVKGGRERTIPLPTEVRKAIEEYLRLDAGRRSKLGCGGSEAYIFQPEVNYRTLIFDKPLSTAMVWNVVRRWGSWSDVGKLSPHDLRRTAITKALDQGLSYRQVQMMSGHKDPKTVMRYDHHRENMEQNAVNFLNYEEPEPQSDNMAGEKILIEKELSSTEALVSKSSLPGQVV